MCVCETVYQMCLKLRVHLAQTQSLMCAGPPHTATATDDGVCSFASNHANLC